MNEQGVTYWETSVSASKLTGSYTANEQRYQASYPEVKNPSALLEGITKFIQQFAGGQIPDHAFIYVVENPEQQTTPENSKYFFMLSKKKSPKTGRTVGYSLRLLYSPTHEVESLSMIEEDKVVWSPDTMENSLHKIRTQYYMGFVYMLCLWSPGFDVVPEPEYEMSASELLNYIEGEIPSELIEVSLPETEETETSSETETTETETAQLEHEESLFEEDVEAEQEQAESEPEQAETSSQYEVPEVDDTEVVMISPEEYNKESDSEYEDLETDYEELFE